MKPAQVQTKYQGFATNSLLCVCLVVFMSSCFDSNKAPPAPPNDSIQGTLDYYADGKIVGWAAYPNDPAPVEVELFVEFSDTERLALGSTLATIPRPDVAEATKLKSNCGFLFSLPKTVKWKGRDTPLFDGQSRLFSAFVRDKKTTKLVELNSSPKVFILELRP